MNDGCIEYMAVLIEYMAVLIVVRCTSLRYSARAHVAATACCSFLLLLLYSPTRLGFPILLPLGRHTRAVPLVHDLSRGLHAGQALYGVVPPRPG
jgi:hypothetical protein